jgi:hypothetical protein
MNRNSHEFRYRKNRTLTKHQKANDEKNPRMGRHTEKRPASQIEPISYRDVPPHSIKRDSIVAYISIHFHATINHSHGISREACRASQC